MKGCFKIFVGIVSVISAILTGLVFLGLVFSKEEKIEDLLKTLPGRELAALDAVCRSESIEPKQLRPLGVTTDSILRDERNARSVVIRDGHVRVLCLRETKFSQLRDLGAFTELEALWLEKGRLTTWPVLAALTKLVDVQLNDQPLGSPAPNTLPPTLKRLGLAGTKVASIDTLTQSAFDEVNLSRTPIAKLPDQVPAKGQWSLTLDDTRLTRPDGHHSQLPSGAVASGPTLPGGRMEGMAAHKSVNVKITGSALKSFITLALPTNTTLYHASGPVEIECRVATGKLRVWMQEPDDLFGGPWFKAGKISGFGRVRSNGFLATEVSAGVATKARGTLFVQGTPPHFAFVLCLEPVGDVPVTGIDLNLRSTP